MATPKRKQKRRQVEIVRKSYQPSKAELDEDMRIDASPEEAARRLVEPVDIRHISRPKKR